MGKGCKTGFKYYINAVKKIEKRIIKRASFFEADRFQKLTRCFRLTAGYVLKMDSMMSAVRLYLIPLAPSEKQQHMSVINHVRVSIFCESI